MNRIDQTKQTGNGFLWIAAFLSAWASVRACRLSTFHLFGGLLFLFYLLLGRQLLTWGKAVHATGKYKITSAIISSIFTLLYLCADYQALLNGLNSPLFQAGHLLIIAAGLFLLFGALLFSLFCGSQTSLPFIKAEKLNPDYIIDFLPFLFSFA